MLIIIIWKTHDKLENKQPVGFKIFLLRLLIAVRMFNIQILRS